MRYQKELAMTCP